MLNRIGLCWVGGFVLLAASVAAQPPVWRIDRGDVRIVVPLMPGGKFDATTHSLDGRLVLGGVKPAVLAGEVTMDLSTIDTGINLRNQHLREKYLEVGKGKGFDHAVLSEIRLVGVSGVDGESFEGRTGFSGTLLLHGMEQPVEGTADITRQGTDRRVRAEFRLTLSDFGIATPEYLGVGVGNKLLVQVQMMATREAAK